MASEKMGYRTPPSDTLSPPLSPKSEAADLEDDQSSSGLLPTLKEPKAPRVPVDQYIPDNYVQVTLDRQKPLPPITLSNLLSNIQWVSFLVLTVTPTLAIIGLFTTEWQRKTAIWSVVYYFMTGLGITAGYHRLWAHRSYNASPALQYVLAALGAGAVEGSIKWWARGHRAHHRYTDTDLDPYNAHKGFWYAHVGWMLVKPRVQIGTADVSDLSRNPVIKWQHKWYLYLIVGMGFIFPTLVAGLGWGDWKGGFFFAGAARLCFVHHSTFCVNSLAHWLGESPFDDKHTPKDHFVTALCTIGEGYHNFHHQFPMDYRNAIKWYQYDPTKWFIIVNSWFGLASHLKAFPSNEIKKGQYTMKLKQLTEANADIKWPVKVDDLPVVSWDDFVEEAKHRPLMVVHGYIIDCSAFAEEHPGGAHFIQRSIGKDATTSFHGGVYDHSNAAHNLIAMLRVGILDGGMEIESLKLDWDYSPINPDRIMPLAPAAQPQASMADRYTLSVPPSERLKVNLTKPTLRPSANKRKGPLEDQSRGERNGELRELLPSVAA